jgi:hypothetical protein
VEEDLWLDDGLEELFLGVPGAPPPEPPPARRGMPARRPTWRPAKETEDERIFREMQIAILPPQLAMAAREEGRKRSEGALEQYRELRHIASVLTPGPKMSLADKRRLEEQKIVQRIEAQDRKLQEREKFEKQIAMNARMAKVRAAKRKKR